MAPKYGITPKGPVGSQQQRPPESNLSTSDRQFSNGNRYVTPPPPSLPDRTGGLVTSAVSQRPQLFGSSQLPTVIETNGSNGSAMIPQSQSCEQLNVGGGNGPTPSASAAQQQRRCPSPPADVTLQGDSVRFSGTPENFDSSPGLTAPPIYPLTPARSTGVSGTSDTGNSRPPAATTGLQSESSAEWR